MAIRPRFVDTDATGIQTGLDWLNAYISMSQCIINEVADLAASGDKLYVLHRASSGTADTNEVTITGYVLSVTSDIVLEAASTDYSSKTGFDVSKYRLSVTDPVQGCLYINEEFVTIKGIQIELGYTASASKAGVRINAVPGSGIFTLDCCYVKGPANAASGSSGIQNFDSSVELDIFNTIITDYDSQGIRVAANANNKIYNNVITNTTGDGIFADTASNGNVKNNAIFNCNTDFDNRGLIAPDYNASDDLFGTNTVSPSGANWANEFPNWATGDYTIVNTGNLYNSGVGPAIDSNVPATDIDGDTRSGNTCSIGVDEFTSGGTIYNVTCADTKSETDANNVIVSINAISSDGIIDSDNDNSILEYTLQATDSVNLNDVVSAISEIATVLSEIVTLSDNASPEKAPIEAICTDNVTLNDLSTGSVTFNAVCPDGISLADFSQAIALIMSSSIDGLNYSDLAIESSQIPQGLVKIVGTSQKLSIIFNVVAKPSITGGN